MPSGHSWFARVVSRRFATRLMLTHHRLTRCHSTELTKKIAAVVKYGILENALRSRARGWGLFGVVLLGAKRESVSMSHADYAETCGCTLIRQKDSCYIASCGDCASDTGHRFLCVSEVFVYLHRTRGPQGGEANGASKRRTARSTY